MSSSSILAVFRSRRMAVVFMLGFSSGLPLMLTGQTLQAWMTGEALTTQQIAAFSAVGLAYTFKFAWAPLLDRYRLPWLGRRRGWLITFQLALIGAIVALGTIDPFEAPSRLFAVALVVAVLAASQDVIVDAYNADLFAPHERAAGSAIYVMGFRAAMLVTGTLALIMADHLVWSAVYASMAALMGVGVIATLLAEEPPVSPRPPRTIAAAIALPFVDLVRRLGWRSAGLMLAFAATYNFGEQFAEVLTMTFFQRGVGFTLTEIALANKLVGFAGWVIGGALGGGLVAKYGLRKMIVAFGILQASTHVAYLVIAIAGKNMVVFCVSIFIENVSLAMATAAFVAALMAVCNPAVSATQFALLTSLASVGKRVFGPLAAMVVDALGWTGFFLTTIALAVPGILLGWVVVRDPDVR